MGTFTTHLLLYKPASGETGWGTLVDANCDILDNFVVAPVVLGLIDASAATAGQIKFPATQNASSDVNTLDDYKEGPWTPSVGGSATYTAQVGKYTKIGKQVTVTCNLQIATLGTGSTTVITGLPFSSQTLATGAVFWASAAITPVTVVALATVGSSSVQLYSATAAAATLNLLGVIGSGTTIDFTLTYFV